MIAPLVSHVPQATASVSHNLAEQCSKPMTNFILSVNISQDSPGTTAKHNLSIKPNYNLKFKCQPISKE